MFEGPAAGHLLSRRATYAGIVPDEYLATVNEAERASLRQKWLTRNIKVYIADLE